MHNYGEVEDYYSVRTHACWLRSFALEICMQHRSSPSKDSHFWNRLSRAEVQRSCRHLRQRSEGMPEAVELRRCMNMLSRRPTRR